MKPNLQRALTGVALGSGLFLLGSYAVYRPHARAVAPASAPLLHAVDVAPPEHVVTHVLRSGETLSGVLAAQDLRGQMADLLLSLREYANPRRLSAGAEISVRRWARDGSTRAVDVRLNADSTVRLEPGPTGWDARVVVTPVSVDTIEVAGRIERGRTLYQEIVENEDLELPASERIQLVVSLASIYGYKLDFAHEIQPGDRFRVVYEREARPDGTARSRRILASEIDNQGKAFRAFYFHPRDERYGAYYDDAGKSLRLAFNRYPVSYVRITSAFNPHRYHPMLGIYRAHTGTDFGANAGTPAHATGAGTVVFAGRRGGYGNLVILRHWDGYTTRYAHLRAFARGIHPGVHVDQNQVVGYVGQTGLATAPHLHYEIRRFGKALNPRTVQLPGAPPLPKSELERFRAILGPRLALLDAVSYPTDRLATAPSPPDDAGTPAPSEEVGSAGRQE